MTTKTKQPEVLRRRVDSDALGQRDAEPPDLMGYAEAARLLAIPVGTLYGWTHRRRVPFIRIGPRMVRFSRRALQGWLDERAVEPRVDCQREI